MKVTICGSIAFYEEMLKSKKELESMGHEVDLPPNQVKDGEGNMIPVQEYYRLRKECSDDNSWIWDNKKLAIKTHFDKIVWGDAVLILNYPKNGIDGYIGANTLMEMGLALHLNKPIYLLNNIPEISYKEEILGMKPIVIEGNLNLIK